MTAALQLSNVCVLYITSTKTIEVPSIHQLIRTEANLKSTWVVLGPGFGTKHRIQSKVSEININHRTEVLENVVSQECHQPVDQLKHIKYDLKLHFCPLHVNHVHFPVLRLVTGHLLHPLQVTWCNHFNVKLFCEKKNHSCGCSKS